MLFDFNSSHMYTINTQRSYYIIRTVHKVKQIRFSRKNESKIGVSSIPFESVCVTGGSCSLTQTYKLHSCHFYREALVSL